MAESYVYPGTVIQGEVEGRATDLVLTARVFARRAKDSIGPAPLLEGVTFGLIATPTNVLPGSVTPAPAAVGGVATAGGDSGGGTVIIGMNP